MAEQIELRDLLFENMEDVLEMVPKENQRRFVGAISETIAAALAGINEGYPGFFKIIYSDETPVGAILIGRGPVSREEPEVMQKYEYVYRLWDFFIDQRYQRRGIGKAALKLALERINEYPDAKNLPLYLECHKENKVALSLYESFGFRNIGYTIEDVKWMLVCFPDRTNDERPEH